MAREVLPDDPYVQLVFTRATPGETCLGLPSRRHRWILTVTSPSSVYLRRHVC